MKKGYVIYNSLGRWLNENFVWLSSTDAHWVGRQFIHPPEAMYAVEKVMKNAEIQPVLKMKAVRLDNGDLQFTGEAYSFAEVVE